MSGESFYPRHRDGQVQAHADFPQMEKDTLKYWEQDDTFRKSVNQRPTGRGGDNEFVFYDGPPFANGLPHYGHLLTGYVKDVVGRYQTMRGRHVERRFGWDTHGLPAELEAEKVLGITDKTQIEGEGGVGIAAFNKAAKESVLKYTEEWKEYVTRQARWVDFDHDYKTLDLSYMESVIWAFKQLYDKGLIYQGFRVLPYCWNDETPLTNHELKMDDDVYQDRTDQSCTVGLRMESGELALIWTTTPWTLPSNLAITVGPDIDYVEVTPAEGDLAGEHVLLAQSRLNAYAKELGEDPQVVRTLKGSELVGQRYYPIFDYFASADKLADEGVPGPHAFTIVAANFVTTEDGTGLVHTAPAFGEDDMLVCQEYDIRAVVPVDSRARFTSEVPEYEGVQVFDANKLVLAHLREGSGPLARIPADRRAKLVRQESFAHSYPHCWRCRKPLIYKAETSWFVKVSAFRDRMVELNQQITWVPDYIKDGIFGNWLKGARDWSISRERFWGSPIPVWKSDNPAYPRVDVYGSLEELKRDFGVDVTNLHRPDIDDLVRPNPDDPTGKSMMRRVPEVLDTWFDSGSMPFAQVHYPFENRDWFEHHYPGDFIVEYIGQTRGWFYTLHVMATALFDRPSFINCVSHGIVLGDDGRKMSKSLRNYPDPLEVFDKYGSDAMRWFLMASPVVSGGNLIVAEQAIRDTVRQTLLPIWNTYFFFTLYAGACQRIGDADGSGYHANLLPLVGTDTNVPDEAKAQQCLDGLETMDRYLLAHTAELVDQVRDALDAYDVVGSCALVQSYLDVLTNWYVRTQRQRFWDEDARAFDTLYTALVTFMQVIDPLLPLLSEEIWRGLTGGESVHLTDYPRLAHCVDNADLVRAMDEVRDVVSAAHSLRKTNNLRVRQPLQDLLIVSELADQLTPFKQLVASEVNVKQVTLTTPANSGLSVHTELKLNPATFAPEIKRSTSQLFKAQKAGEWTVSEDGQAVTFPNVQVSGQPVSLSVTEGQCVLVQTVEAAPGEVATVMPNGTFVVLNVQVTDELEAEGFARDVVRAVQDERKNADLNISDRIHLTLGVPAAQMEAVNTWRAMIAHETLATEVDVQQSDKLSVHVEVADQE